MKRATSIAVTATTILLLAAAARAQTDSAEKKLKKAEVPAPVLEAVTRKYPNAKLRNFGEETDEGKKVYEVELTSGKDQVSIDVSPEGKILAEETVIAPATLPVPIKAALQASKYKGWRIARAETVVHDERPDTLEYEVVVQSKKEKFEVVLDKAGKITKEEAKRREDTD
jgi:uncharacterized membrane protein YkoI